MLCAVLVFVFLYMRNADMEVDMEIQSGAVIVRFYPLGWILGKFFLLTSSKR